MLLESRNLHLVLQRKVCQVAGRSAACSRMKTVPARAASFSGAEAEVYLRVHKEAKAAFERFLCYGGAHVNKHLLAIMSLLGPLRRCCSGGALRPRVRCPELKTSSSPKHEHRIHSHSYAPGCMNTDRS